MKHKHPADRKAEILTAALETARTDGYRSVSRETIAARADCSPGLVSYYFSTMKRLRRAVMSAAIARRDLVVLAQGLAAGDAKARSAPDELKQAAARGLL
jgi:AcrR family transcriptional regulator